MILIVCLLIQPLPTIPIKIVLNMSDRCWQHKNTNKLSCSPTNNNKKKKKELKKKGRLHTQGCHFSVTNKRDDTDVALQYPAEAAGATPPCPNGSPWKRQPDPRQGCAVSWKRGRCALAATNVSGFVQTESVHIPDTPPS